MVIDQVIIASNQSFSRSGPLFGAKFELGKLQLIQFCEKFLRNWHVLKAAVSSW